jgi:hypothetical protein
VGPPEIGELSGANALRQRFFYWRTFAKSLPEKYDFDLKEGFSTKKNDPNSPDFKKKILQIARFLLLVPVGSKKYRKDLIFSYLHISTCSQIWLNHFPDDSHLGYITKLEKETLPSGGPPSGEPTRAGTSPTITWLFPGDCP